MGISLWLGNGFRYHNLPGGKNQFIGWCSIIAFMCMALSMNLIFATFRVQYGQITDSGNWQQLRQAFFIAVQEAFGVFLLRFPDIDFNSFILFFIGLGCSGFAFYKGYTIDDKYPGHGELDREFKTAEQSLLALQKRTHEESSANLNQKIAEIQALRTSLIQLVPTLNAIWAKAERSYAIFATNIAAIQGELDLVSNAYRGANRDTRTVPAPGYFGYPISVTPAMQEEQASLKEVHRRYVTNLESTHPIVETQTASLNQVLLEMHVNATALLAEFPARMTAIQVEAEQAIANEIPHNPLQVHA